VYDSERRQPEFTAGPTRTLIVGVGKLGCALVDELIMVEGDNLPYTEFWMLGVDPKVRRVRRC
jgi:hypothetical protein